MEIESKQLNSLKNNQFRWGAPVSTKTQITTNLMKIILLAIAIFLMGAGILNAQNDTMYVYKAGVVVGKYNVNTEIDSVIFYKPAEPTNSPTYVARILIPAGTFTMGSPETEYGRINYGFFNEVQHSVTLSAFRMSKYEITNAQFAAFCNSKNIGSDGLYAAGSNPTQRIIWESNAGSFDFGLHYTNGLWVPAAGYENSPVINVNWFGATDFANSIGGKLPTEAQWEYACRAGTTTPFNTGNCLTNSDACYDWSFTYNTCINTITTRLTHTHPVGSYLPNAFGL